MNEIQKSWYAVYTLSRSEKKLAQELSKKGISNYLPLLSERKRWSDRIQTVQTPLFASYVFVNVDIRTEKLKVLETSGAHHFLSVSGIPHPIPDDDIENTRIFVTEYPDKIKIEREEMMLPGKPVLITGGPFKGRRALVERKGNRSSIYVSISGIQTRISLELDHEMLETGEES
ncbi:UpxY family transcription antiterminator [Leptospira langatensis]|uniref:UpxY family transcription antiterminator n=1 Tax=Leptospira langatensis TaxID=2484983 RepID=A0A5F1ZTV3_9LEPT|nr:UpxY family transcription antiterminator [Leptospira langatensis]TGK03117.1 UpxY family transcription antiterminator [Leptospira langatensis]TGL41874.1 UpxY family transcription antiterminator [Leptospira langatensis]